MSPILGRRKQKQAAAQQQATAQQPTAAQQQPAAAQEQAAAAAAPAAAAPGGMTDEKMAQLQKLGELKAAGILTEEEFTAEKAKILAS